MCDGVKTYVKTHRVETHDFPIYTCFWFVVSLDEIALSIQGATMHVISNWHCCWQMKLKKGEH